MNERAVSTITSKDGERRMLIVRRDDGLFRFVEEVLYRDDEFIKEPIWGPKRDRAGLYETAEEAKAVAKVECQWFADEVD